MKAKLVPVNNPDGTTAYISMLPVSDSEYELLKSSGAVFDTDMLEKPMYLSHGYSIQTPVTSDLQAQLAAANERIAELEAVCREVVTALELEQIEDDIHFAIPAPREFKTHYDLQGDDYERLFDAFAHLLDILPPAE